MEKLLYTGKAKQMWQTEDPAVLRVVYLDQATALNGKRRITLLVRVRLPMLFPPSFLIT